MKFRLFITWLSFFISSSLYPIFSAFTKGRFQVYYLEVYVNCNYFPPLSSSGFSTCQGIFLVRISSFLISVPFNEISSWDIIKSCFVRGSCCKWRTGHAFKQNMHFFLAFSSHTLFPQCFSYYVSMLWPLNPFQERHTIIQIIQCSECRMWKNILAPSLSLLRSRFARLHILMVWPGDIFTLIQRFQSPLIFWQR